MSAVTLQSALNALNHLSKSNSPGRDEEARDMLVIAVQEKAKIDAEAMLAIQELMSGEEWDSETFSAISEIMQKAGYDINDLEDEEEDED